LAATVAAMANRHRLDGPPELADYVTSAAEHPEWPCPEVASRRRRCSRHLTLAPLAIRSRYIESLRRRRVDDKSYLDHGCGRRELEVQARRVESSAGALDPAPEPRVINNKAVAVDLQVGPEGA